MTEYLITKHLDLWTSAIEAKSTAGRGSSNKFDLYGIKKLRELILELAVRGKLVPQNLADEPASELFKKIQADIQKVSRNKRNADDIDITENEIPFGLPTGWIWKRLSQIGHDWGQKTPEGEFTYIDVGSINKELGLIDSPSIVSSKDAPSRARKIVKKGTVIYSTVRPYLLNIAIIDKEFDPEPIASTAFAVVHPFNGVNERYIYRYLRSPTFVSYVESCQTGIAYPAINDKQFFSGLIPIPPGDEQKRIVKKVDELMELCDQLEQQTLTSMEAHTILVETLLTTLTASADADELAQNWNRISEHFDTLFTTEQSIDLLKQTILQLAVMGKLVPQDPTDEPASVLLEKIAAEKAQLIKDKKIKKEKPLPAISDDEKPFELPQGWAFARFGDLATRLGSGSTPRGGANVYLDEGIPFLRSQNVWNDGLRFDDIAFISNEIHQKMENTKVIPGDILLNITGASLGRSTIFPLSVPEANVSQHVTVIRLIRSDMNRFIHLLIQSPLIQQLVWQRQVGVAIEGLSKKVLEQFETPIPPFREQKLIVEQVDKLLAVCEDLKNKLIKTQCTKCKLTEAIVDGELR